MKPTILFDLDGTLIDSTSAILDGFFYAFDKFELSRPSEKAITTLIGYPLDIMFANLGIKSEFVDKFVGTYKEKYLKIHLDQTKLIDSVSEAVKFANSFADLGVVTTKGTNSSTMLLDRFQILSYFKTVIGRDEIINPKPHAEPILKALSNLGKTAQNAFMVGDTKLDAISAKNADIKSIGVKCGYGSEDELKKYCDFVCENPLEAVEIVFASV